MPGQYEVSALSLHSTHTPTHVRRKIIQNDKVTPPAMRQHQLIALWSRDALSCLM